MQQPYSNQRQNKGKNSKCVYVVAGWYTLEYSYVAVLFVLMQQSAVLVWSPVPRQEWYNC